MATYTDYWHQQFDARGVPTVLHGGQLWKASGPVVSQVTPATEPTSIDAASAHRIMRTLGGRVIYWTSGFPTCGTCHNWRRIFFQRASAKPSTPGVTAECSDWYSVICRKFMPIEGMSANTRSKVRRGLKRCEVRRISAHELAERGYETYIRAQGRYRHATVDHPSKHDFQSRVARDDDFPALRHQWGVFSDGELVAFAQNAVYDEVEVNYSVVKFDPAHSAAYPVYALIHTMNEYYLNDQKVTYVNDGFCSVYHDTEFQRFLLEQFNFVRAYTRLTVHYDWMLGTVLALARPLGQLPARIDRRLGALCEMERRSRARLLPPVRCWSGG